MYRKVFCSNWYDAKALIELGEFDEVHELQYVKRVTRLKPICMLTLDGRVYVRVKLIEEYYVGTVN